MHQKSPKVNWAAIDMFQYDSAVSYIQNSHIVIIVKIIMQTLGSLFLQQLT